MATKRRYSRTTKVAAIVAAEATSVLAAAEAMGIPRETLRDWIHNDKYAEVRQNVREGMAEESGWTARLALRMLGNAIADGELEPKDLINATGMLIEKTQLLNGGATGRTESRDLTGSLSDDDVRQIVRTAEDLLGAGTGRDAEASASPSEGEGLQPLPD